jgi:hypothetical protein
LLCNAVFFDAAEARARRVWHDRDLASGSRLLIATGAAAVSVGELPELVRALIQRASDVLVMTPILTTALQWIASDTDRARYEADERLRAVLGDIQALAPEAATHAQIGDETPMTAFADAIGQFQPDHILVALRSTDDSGWQERGLTDALRRDFHIPITVFEIDAAGRVPSAGT